jgi:hypothetical protein
MSGLWLFDVEKGVFDIELSLFDIEKWVFDIEILHLYIQKKQMTAGREHCEKAPILVEVLVQLDFNQHP